MGVQSKQIFEFDSYELDKTFADFDNFVLIKIKSNPSKVIRRNAYKRELMRNAKWLLFYIYCIFVASFFSYTLRL